MIDVELKVEILTRLAELAIIYDQRRLFNESGKVYRLIEVLDGVETPRSIDSTPPPTSESAPWWHKPLKCSSCDTRNETVYPIELYALCPGCDD